MLARQEGSGMRFAQRRRRSSSICSGVPALQSAVRARLPARGVRPAIIKALIMAARMHAPGACSVKSAGWQVGLPACWARPTQALWLAGSSAVSAHCGATAWGAPAASRVHTAGDGGLGAIVLNQAGEDNRLRCLVAWPTTHPQVRAGPGFASDPGAPGPVLPRIPRACYAALTCMTRRVLSHACMQTRSCPWTIFSRNIGCSRAKIHSEN